MLPKKHRLKFKNINKSFQKSFIQTKDFDILLKKKPEDQISQFAINVNLKVSKRAVERNKVKRRISETIRRNLPLIKPGYDLFIFAKPTSVHKKSNQLEKDLLNAFNNAKILKPENK